MHGSIRVESQPGQGSVFIVDVRLPLSDQESLAAPVSDPAAIGVGLALNILLVEDNAVNQAVATNLLRKQGHSVTVAANGLLAVEAFQQGAFDVILMDVQMPEMDGIDSTLAIRKLEQSSHSRIPIIAMTAQTMPGDRDRCFAAGMDAFVSKPIHFGQLCAVLQEAAASLAVGLKN